MGPHPRYWIVSKASIDINRALNEAIARHELTHAELTSILLGTLQQWNKYAIRDERETEGTTTDHPTPPDR